MANSPLSGAEVIIECLKREGIDTIFGYPGGSAIPMFDAILDSNIKVVLTRHEQGATHMADGYARQTGKVGVALVTPPLWILARSWFLPPRQRPRTWVRMPSRNAILAV